MTIPSSQQLLEAMPSDIRVSRMLRQVDADLSTSHDVVEAVVADAVTVDAIKGLVVSLSP
jgi:hypothetical protein